MSKNKNAVIEAVELGYRYENGNIISPRNRSLKLIKSKNMRYFYFNLKIDKKVTHVYVHKFVAYLKYGNDAFIDGIQVRHLDDDHVNNDPSNIAIGTASDNMFDIPKQNRIQHAAKASRKYDDEFICNVRNDKNKGFTYSELMKKYSIGKSTIHYILNNEYV